MVRLFVRFVGVVALAVAFAALIVDGTRSIATGRLAIEPLGRIAAALFPDLFQSVRTIAMAHLPILWDPVIVAVLLWPAWLVFGLFGMVLVALTRRPAAKIGYTRR